MGAILPEDLIAALNGLPEESEHCATLAVSALQNAIFNRQGLPSTWPRFQYRVHGWCGPRAGRAVHCWRPSEQLSPRRS